MEATIHDDAILCLSLLDNHPTKLTIQSDHTHVFDTVHVDTCDETCAVEEIVGVVQLNTNGLDSGCDPEQCGTSCLSCCARHTIFTSLLNSRKLSGICSHAERPRCGFSRTLAVDILRWSSASNRCFDKQLFGSIPK